MEQVNHLSLNLAGDPVMDPPDEVVLLEPHMKMAETIGKIRKAVDERLSRCESLLITGRLGLFPAFMAARGYLVDEVARNEDLFGAVVSSPHGIFCPWPPKTTYRQEELPLPSYHNSFNHGKYEPVFGPECFRIRMESGATGPCIDQERPEMNDFMVFIAFGEKILAIPQANFREALRRGDEIMGGSAFSGSQPSGGDQKLLDADGASAMTGVPASWFLEAVRKGEVPHVKFGKYVRFRLGDLLTALKKRPRSTMNIAPDKKKRLGTRSVTSFGSRIGSLNPARYCELSRPVFRGIFPESQNSLTNPDQKGGENNGLY